MLTRRAVLKNGLGLSGALLLGCASEPLKGNGAAPDAGSGGTPDAGPDAPDTGDCADPFATGTLLGTAAFIGESTTPLDQAFNQGLDGRLYTDLSLLTPDRLLTPSDEFYIRTRYPDLLVNTDPWLIHVAGLVGAPVDLDLGNFGDLIGPRGVHLMECSGNARGASFGLLSSADWDGMLLADLLQPLQAAAGATRLLVSGFDQYSQPSAGNSLPGASWVFALDDLMNAGAFLATRMNGEALLPDHGAPLRLVVPGWYGCTCIKWVNELSFVDDSEPSTAQMREFASRTMQTGVPTLAKDFIPAQMDTAAMPVRVERWQLDGGIAYRVVGIVWGGTAPVDRLEVRFGSGEWEPVSVCPSPATTSTWALWSHTFRPSAPGDYDIVLRVPDPSVRTRRLDIGYYLRQVRIDSV